MVLSSLLCPLGGRAELMIKYPANYTTQDIPTSGVDRKLKDKTKESKPFRVAEIYKVSSHTLWTLQCFLFESGDVRLTKHAALLLKAAESQPQLIHSVVLMTLFKEK